LRGPGAGAAAYGLGELHRLRGDASAAEGAYARATDHGRTPYPGLALLRLETGQGETARAAIERALAEPLKGRQRATLLAGAVEILVASGDVAGAARASAELQAIADRFETPWLRAMAASAQGAVWLAEGRANDALTPLRTAAAIWRDLDASYEVATVTVLIGRACRALGDDDGARLEWDAAARVFRQFGAAPALAELESLMHSRAVPVRAGTGGLSPRELEVLRLIAKGHTNRVIARDLDISEKTVARHVSNIFTKLDLTSRAAATAFAFTHGLVPGSTPT